MSETDLYDQSSTNSETFLQYGNDKQPPPIVVVVGDGRSRVRRVVRTATRHVTVVSYSTRHKETRTHTSHHVTTVSFPQKSIDRNGSSAAAQYGDISSAGGVGPPGSTSSGGSSLSTDGGGGGVVGAGGGSYIYLQQHYTPSSVSGGSVATINYPQPPPSSHMVYQHQPQSGAGVQQQQQQQYQTCHQQQQQQQYLQQQTTNIVTAGGIHHMNLHHQPHHHHHHHMLHGVNVGGGGGGIGGVGHHHHHHHHHNHNGAVVIAGSGIGTGMTTTSCSAGGGGGGGGTSPSAAAMQQNFHKKNSMRSNGDVLKRSRAQTAYELSQDLLEKQIELLERKYGGIRARNAAIIIQRAFRHFMMVKKFASITAMAKAEKRLSRRMLMAGIGSGGGGGGAMPTSEQIVDDGPASNSSVSSAYGSATESQYQQQQQQQPRVTIMAGPPMSAGAVVAGSGSTASASSSSSSRTPPTRSLSMRERRQLDGSPIPRSQSGSCNNSISGHSTGTPGSSSMGAHPHVNLLHATEGHHYYSAHQISGIHAAQYYPTYHAMPHDTSYASSASANSSSASSSSHLDATLNASWVSASGSSSPHTPYYSAAQIYMRPKTGTVIVGGGSMTSADRKKVPPEVPKRTSSITAQQHAQHMAAQQMLMMRQTPPPMSQQPLPSSSSASSSSSLMRANGLCKTAENGSLTSVQSSGSDSSVTSADRAAAANSDLGSDRSNSPHTHTWKRGNQLNSSQQSHSDGSTYTHVPIAAQVQSQAALVSSAVVGGPGVVPIASSLSAAAAAVAADEHGMSSHTSAAQYEQHDQQEHQLNASTATPQNYKVSETIRKRQYRVGLNLFNKKPEKGITYLIRRGFLENTPQGVARFLISRKGLSRQMIGEYLGNLQNPFNMAVLNCFALELDLSGMQVDVALRKFQTYFRMPGEAQKIERLMEIFSHRYCQCNQDIVGRLRSSDTIFVLAFAIIMLNTDLHTPNLKPERRMRVEDFIKNLRGIDDCHDIDRDMLAGIYERVKANEFKPGSDHVTQVMKVQATIVGKKPNLALPHRRLVCYCRLYEIPDINKKERPGVHQREVFLFNDLLVITKIFSKKKSSVTYTFRNSFPLCGMVVSLLDVTNYPFCIQLSQKVDGKILITFNARNEHDRCKFAEDLKESISEMDEMESLRIEAELERQKSARNRAVGSSENRDSGVADVEVCPCPYQAANATGEPAQYTADASSQHLKRSALSNSLLDMHEQFGNDKPQRRGSVGSLDSGMSISFQSTTTSSASRENAALIVAAANAAASKIRFPMPTTVGAVYTTAPGGGVSVGVGYTQPHGHVHAHPHAHTTQGHAHVNYIAQNQAILLQQQPQQQQQLILQQPQSQQAVVAHVNVQQQQQQQPQPTTGRIPGRERKLSRSDESGRSTEV